MSQVSKYTLPQLKNHEKKRRSRTFFFQAKKVLVKKINKTWLNCNSETKYSFKNISIIESKT